MDLLRLSHSRLSEKPCLNNVVESQSRTLSVLLQSLQFTSPPHTLITQDYQY